ncbi:hypothetical protein D3C87_1385550 [compost metagenome]
MHRRDQRLGHRRGQVHARLGGRARHAGDLGGRAGPGSRPRPLSARVRAHPAARLHRRRPAHADRQADAATAGRRCHRPGRGRPRRRVAGHVATDVAGGYLRGLRQQRDAVRRDRRRQGAHRAAVPRAQHYLRQGAVRRRELRGDSGRPVRVPVLRPRQGRVHGRHVRPPGLLRAGYRRHAVPR